MTLEHESEHFNKCQGPHTHILQPGTSSSRLFQQLDVGLWTAARPGTLKLHKLVPFSDVRDSKVLWQCA